MKPDSLERFYRENYHDAARVADDPVEIVAIAIPVLAELIVVTAFIGMIVVWIAIANTPAVTG